MRALVDTHVFLWWLADDDRLRESTRTVIGDPDTRLLLSAASAWEIAIKSAHGRLDMARSVEAVLTTVLVQARFERLAIEFEHAVVAATLPGIHGDPFDRMLVAQAMTLGCPIVTQDPKIARYPVETIW
jgi:PIN domain nuclease of toxin-antitoxin system